MARLKMTRLTLAVLLLVVNLLYFGWVQIGLPPYGVVADAPTEPSEPPRLAQQIQPEAISEVKVMSPALWAAFVPATPQPAKCLQAGLFKDEQGTALRDALVAGMPVGTWLLNPVVQPARWIVYVGRFADPNAAALKRAELKAVGIRDEALRNPALVPGLSLGGFASEGLANAWLEQLKKRGLQKAQVVKESPELQGLRLRLPAADEALLQKLKAFEPLLAGKALEPC